MKYSKQRYMLLPFWLTWKSFIWYALFLAILIIFGGIFLLGASIALKNNEIMQKDFNKVSIVIGIIILLGFILVWTPNIGLFNCVWTYSCIEQD